jgi:hypothetical protein
MDDRVTELENKIDVLESELEQIRLEIYVQREEARKQSCIDAHRGVK